MKNLYEINNRYILNRYVMGFHFVLLILNYSELFTHHAFLFACI